MLRQRVVPKRLQLNSFIRGFGKLFDFGGTLVKYDDIYLFSKQADANAIRSDWEQIGADIKDAFQYMLSEMERQEGME